MSIRARFLALLLPAIIFFPVKTFADTFSQVALPGVESASVPAHMPAGELTADARFITVAPGKTADAEPLQPIEQPSDVKHLAKATPQDNVDSAPAPGSPVATAPPAAAPVSDAASVLTPTAAKQESAPSQPAVAAAPATSAKPAPAASSSDASPAPSAKAAGNQQPAADTSAASAESLNSDNAGAAVFPSFIKDNTATVVSPEGQNSSADQMAGAQAADMPAAGQPVLAGGGLDSAAGASIPPSGLLAPIARNIKYFSVTVKKHFQQWLARSGRYMGLMKGILRENYMPEDLVFLALIESGFNPRAYSWAKACGPWQFIKGTAVRYGLRVDSWVDERRDPIKSTQAAAAYLKDLYGTFGSWPLAMASYNAGAGMVERAINRTGGIQDFWQLRKTRYMPSETKDYVPKFIAARMIAENPDNFGFKDLSYDKPFVFDEVQLNHCTDLRTVALCCGVSLDKIKELNPELIRGCTPPGQSYTLRIPKGKKAEFLAAYNSLPKSERYAAPRTRIVNSRYIVRRRTTLKALAGRLGVPAIKLARANHLKTYSWVGRGRRLIVPHEKTVIAADIPSHLEIADIAASDGSSSAETAANSETDAKSRTALDKLETAPAVQQPECPAKPDLRLGSLLPSPTAADADETASSTNQQAVTVSAASAPRSEEPHHYTPHRSASRSRHTVSRSVVYRVRKGDTLASIARRRHTTVAKLARLNHLGRRRIIKPGQRLKLSTIEKVASHSRRERTAHVRRSRHEKLASHGRHSRHRRVARSRRYRVRSGDTLWSIARKFGVSRKKLSRVNSMHGRHSIRKGQTIIIPAA